jgi:predicted TPR repeat methyltransferase
MARHLSGVDMAPRMIEKARQRGVYDELTAGDLTLTLKERPRSFDLILAADVFNYVGCLDDVFEVAARALRPGGLFAFTIESIDTGDYMLRRSRRYAQSVTYIRRLALSCGFAEVSVQKVELRKEANMPVDARLIVLRFPGT